MNGLEERVAKIEGAVSQMNERLNHLGNEITGLRGEMKEMEKSLRGEISGLRSEMNGMEKSLRAEIRSNFKWTLGILIPMWVTIIGTFVGLFLTLVK